MIHFILAILLCGNIYATDDGLSEAIIETRDLSQDYEMFEAGHAQANVPPTRSLVFGYAVQSSNQSVMEHKYNNLTSQQFALSYLGLDEEGSALGVGVLYRSLFQHAQPYSWEIQNWGLGLDSIASFNDETEETLGWFLRAKLGPQMSVRYTRSSSAAGQAKRVGYFAQASLGKEIKFYKQWNGMIEAQVQYMRSALAKSLSYGVEVSLRVGI